MPADAPDIIRDYREWIRDGASPKRNADEISKLYDVLIELNNRLTLLEAKVLPRFTPPPVVLGEDQPPKP